MISAIAFVIVASFASRAHGAILNRCPGGYSIGEEPVRGRYWYRCGNNGVLSKEGCLDPNGRRIRVGEHYVENEYVMTCRIVDDYLRLVQTGCADETGRIYQPGETWQGKTFWYTCEDRGEYIFVTVSGCLLYNQRLRLNEKKQYDGVVYECQLKGSGGTALCSVGCVYEGREYSLGQTFRSDNFKLSCTKQGGYCHTAAVACLDEFGGEHRDGETWQSGDGYYRCNARADQKPDRATIEVLGCYDRSQPGRQRRAGETWEENGQRYQCTTNNNRAYKQSLGYV